MAARPEVAVNDALPGTSKAVLTLADGQQILLDSARDGDLARQSNVLIRKTGDGALVYSPSSGVSTATVAFNTLSTPRGGLYTLTLPDGTRAWLNAASAITYPTAFNGRDRSVKISGEVYLEVAKNAAQPFKVSLPDGQQIEVLGTSFNLKNTGNFELALVEGSVEVADTKGEVIKVLPNEMLIKEKNGKVSKTGFDPLEVLGWKDQYLIFKDDSFEEVIAKLESWFGVDIKSELVVDANWSYSGVYHNKPINYVLDGISISSEFIYTINNNTVTISNP